MRVKWKFDMHIQEFIKSRILFTAFFLLLGLYSGCVKEVDMSDKKKTISFVLIKSFPNLLVDSNESILNAESESKPQGYWLRSENALTNSGFNFVRSDASTLVDWQSQDLILITLGVQGTTGHEVQIQQIEIQNNILRIAAKHLEPTIAVGEALTNPAVLVRIDKPNPALLPVLNIDGKDTNSSWQVLD
jgi:hypothetical protein